MNNLSKEYGKRVRVNSPGSCWNGQYGNIVKIFYGIQFDDENVYRNIIEEHVEEAYKPTEPEKVEEETPDKWTVYALNDKRYYNHICNAQLFDYPWFYCPICGRKMIGVDYDRQN
jgi:hypothetical protein